MGFAAAAPIIAAGISSASSGKGGKGGGGSGGGSFQQQNFAPFQQPAIDQVFNLLGGGEGSDLLLGGTGRTSLLETPRQASSTLSNALGFTNSLLAGTDAGTKGLQNFESLVNSDIGRQPFNSTIDDISDLRDSIEQSFLPFSNRALELSNQGANTEFRDLLLGSAQRDPAANPFIDRLVGDVSADVRANVLDNSTAAGGLESSGFGQQLARETARASNQIRSAAFESEANRSLQAAQSGAQFDLNDLQSRLNAVIAGGNISSQSAQGQLGAQGQINDLTKAEETRRANLISQRFNAANALAQLPLAGLQAAGPLAQQFTELPFGPLSNFNALATQPLGQTRIAADSGSGGGKGGAFGDILGGSLTTAGLLDEAGVFGDLFEGPAAISQGASDPVRTITGTGLTGPSSSSDPAFFRP